MKSKNKELSKLEKENKYVFHGSEGLIDEFEPRQAHTIIEGQRMPDGKPAVFASPFASYATFMAIINKTNCSKGLRSGCSYSNRGLEFTATKATLDQLNEESKGYVYIFDRSDFEQKNGSEWVSYKKVKPIRFVEVHFSDLPSPIAEIPEDYPMIYLYHSVPKNLQGDILYPLNELREKHPAIYEQQVSKYVGREHITQQRIPKLDCLWNDVLHFSAVNPKEVKQALIEAGRSPDFTISYYQVDPKLIEPKNSIVYLYAHADNKNKMNEENFAPYNPEEVAKFSEMPQATKDYYKEMIGKGERPLLYHKIPHILYKGTLDITNLPIISV